MGKVKELWQERQDQLAEEALIQFEQEQEEKERLSNQRQKMILEAVLRMEAIENEKSN